MADFFGTPKHRPIGSWLFFLLGFSLALLWIVKPFQALTGLDLGVSFLGLLMMSITRYLLAERERWMMVGFYRIQALAEEMPRFPVIGYHSVVMQAFLDFFVLVLFLRITISGFSWLLFIPFGFFAIVFYKWIRFVRWIRRYRQSVSYTDKKHF